jgi:glycosyltransferase involved in cell wall biosynthesis
MKIVQIGSFPMDSAHIQGGVESSVYGLASELIKEHKLCVIDVPRSDVPFDKVEIIDEIQVFRFSNHRKSNSSALLRIGSIISIVRRQKPDICHIHTTNLFSLCVFIILKLYKLPVIITVHGLAHIEKQNIWNKQKTLKYLIKYITQSITEFFFISISGPLIVDTNYVKEAIELYRKQHKIFHLPLCNVIPQGIHSIFFDLQHAPQRNQLLSVGSINKRKGHLLLIESMVKIKEYAPDFRLTIAGALSDEAYYQEMKAAITENSLNNNIQIVPNASFEDILEFFKRAEIFVLHSEEESQGIVFCEAMAAGIPIVATSVGGIPWVVQNNLNGLLSGFGDINTFATNVIKLMGDDSKKKRMEETNSIQSHKYEWKYITQQILDLYKSVV